MRLTQPITAQCTNLTEWSTCSATCGNGTRTRSKECEKIWFGEGRRQEKKYFTVSEFEECITDCSSTTLLVVGGFPERLSEHADIIHFSIQEESGTSTKVSIAPYDNIKLAFGGTIQDTPLLCGGYFTDYSSEYSENVDIPNCYALNNDGNWTHSSTLTRPRFGASAVVINDSLLVTGGATFNATDENQNIELLAETEVVNLEKSQSFVSMPQPIVYHCLIKINESHVLSTGGNILQDGESIVVNATFLFNFDTKKWTSGPSLQEARMTHGCGSFQLGDSTVLLVASGTVPRSWFTEDTRSVEILNTDEWSKGWQIATQKLPLTLRMFSILPSPNNRGLIVTGGYNAAQDLNNANLLRFECTDDTIESCKWETSPQKMLLEGRNGHVALWIPDTIKTTKYQSPDYF